MKTKYSSFLPTVGVVCRGAIAIFITTLALAGVALAAPVAAPGGPYVVPVGGTLSLNGSTSEPSLGQNITNYEWALDDSDLTAYQLTGVTPAAIPYATLVSTYGMAVGANTVRLRVTDDSDPVESATADVTVTLAALPVIHEPFAQTAGTLNAKAASTTGLTGNWTVGAGTVNVVTPSTMVFGGLAMTDGHANLLRSGNTNARVTRSSALADAGLLADDAELWFSLIIMKTAGGGSNEWSGFAFGTSHLSSGPGTLTLQGGNGLGFQTRDTNVTVGTWNATTTPATGSSLALTYNVPSLIVGKIKWGATVSDVETITLYKPSANLSTLGTGVSKTMAAVDQSLFTTISYSLRDVDTMNYDEIRFGATQADVMPVDTVPPALLSITDDKAGGPIGEDVEAVTYTLTFNKHMDISTITSADFDNAGDATATVGTVAQVSQTVITVQLLPTTTGTLQLRIPLGSELKSFANLALDTTSDVLDDTTITINAGLTPPGTPSSNRWWDGTTITGATNGVSAGGTATWDNGTTTNWDRGAGFEGPVAWNNANGNTAIFGGTAGTVTLDGNISLDGLTVSLPTGAGTGYSIGSVGEDNTLTFAGTKTVTTTATGTGTNQDVIIRAGIAGSPTMNISGRASTGAQVLQLLPGADVTQTIGTINMLNTFGSNKVLVLGGASTGNAVDQVTWTVTAQQLQLFKGASVAGATATDWTINQNISIDDGTIVVDEGTLIFSGTNNFVSHFIETRSGGRIVLKGNWRIHDEDQDFKVLSGGTVAPGASVGTATINWNSTRTNPGLVDLQSGSTYEWEVGAGVNNTDIIALTEPVVGGDAQLVVGTGTFLKVVDAGGSPSPGDKLTVFTYASGVVAPSAATLNANMTIDLSGTSWTGPGTWGVDIDESGNGTIYITGISGGASTYTVTYDGNGSDGGTVPVDGATYATGATVTVLGNTGSLVKSGFVFTGWNTQADGLGTHYNPAATFSMGVANTTLYADWKTPYQVWAGSAPFGDDANGDGVNNGLAFLLGATNPNENALSLLPDISEDNGNLVLTFSCLNSAARGAAVLNVQYSNDVGLTDLWATNTAEVPGAATPVVPPNAPTIINGVTFVVTTGAGNLVDVTATVDASNALDGKLFGRVSGAP